MQVGVIGLGPFGTHIIRRLLAGDYRVVIFDNCPRRVAELCAEKAYGASSVADLARELDAPRAIWLTGEGAHADAIVDQLLPHLEPDDVILDCTDAYYLEDISRANRLAAARVHYVDVGLSGEVGMPGRPFCLTIGGTPEVVRALAPLFELVSVPQAAANGTNAATASRPGYLRCGPAGAGHFVSMIHDGIERGLHAVFAEGFSLLRGANAAAHAEGDLLGRHGVRADRCEYEFNLAEIADLWRRRSPLSSSVLEEASRSLAPGASLGEGRPSGRQGGSQWELVRAAIDEGTPIPVLTSVMYQTAGALGAPQASIPAFGGPQPGRTGDQPGR